MTIKEEVLKAVEQIIEKLISEKSDLLVDLALKKLAQAIPGPIDDALIAANAPTIKVAVKAEIMKLADLIDGVKGN